MVHTTVGKRFVQDLFYLLQNWKTEVMVINVQDCCSSLICIILLEHEFCPHFLYRSHLFFALFFYLVCGIGITVVTFVSLASETNVRFQLHAFSRFHNMALVTCEKSVVQFDSTNCTKHRSLSRGTPSFILW